MQLNNEQQLAVKHVNGPLLILAGAGSGKTRVLTERIVNLINNGHAHSTEILAVTFTNKAAAEMKTRVEERLGQRTDIWLCTFHSACVRILRRHGEYIGLNPHFVIFDDADQISLAKKVLAELNINEKMLTPRSCVEKISRSKDACIDSKNYPDGDFYHAKIKSVYVKFDEELRKSGAVDFGDLLMLTVKLFNSNPDVLAYYQNRFKFIMVDEYQDTNNAQYQLLKLLSDKHKNIVVVGDPDQSIYAWRGADISNILEFEKDFEGAKLIKLEQNYRSTKCILAASDSVIANNKGRKEKTLWTNNEDGEQIKLIETVNERDEARCIVSEIKEVVKKGFSLRQTAIFYRTNAQSRVFEDELRREGIPYIIYGGVRFYDRAEIKNVIAYLRLINNPTDDISLKRIINVPARGIGKTTVDKLANYASIAKISMYEFIVKHLNTTDFNSGTITKLNNFAALLKELNSLSNLPLQEIVTQTISKSKYVESLNLEQTDEANERIANIDELISAVGDAVRMAPTMVLSDFLDQVALVSDIDSYNESEDVLPLMTLHLAKGLEFPNVFIVGLEEGVLPHIRSVDDEGGLEEERRLFYVGMTRAKKSLTIAHAHERMIRGGYNYNVPSRFLEEIPEKYINKQIYGAPMYSGFYKPEKKKHQQEWNDFSQDAGSSGFDHCFEKTEEVGGFKVGQRVKHPTFGDGIIRKAEGTIGAQRLIVQFKTGELKKLSAQYANLSLI